MKWKKRWSHDWKGEQRWSLEMHGYNQGNQVLTAVSTHGSNEFGWLLQQGADRAACQWLILNCPAIDLQISGGVKPLNH